MAETAVQDRLTELWETPKSIYGWFATVDHKELGIRYIVTAFIFLELDRHYGTHFFTVQGGSTYLRQQLFWFFGHRWVYVIFLPATGMISLIIPQGPESRVPRSLVVHALARSRPTPS